MAKGYDATFPRARRLTKNTKRTDKPDGKPVLFQGTFSSVFVQFLYTVKLHRLTVSVWDPHFFLSKFLFLSFSHGS
jgi:hypothetical protein